MARNLLAHPGAETTACAGSRSRLSAAAQRRREEAGRRTRAVSAAGELLDGLADARSACCDDQARSRAAAATWVRSRRGRTSRNARCRHRRPAPALRAPHETSVRTLPSAATQEATSAPLHRSDRTATPTDGEAQPAAAQSSSTTGTRRDGYRAYTTAHDRVVNAAALASRDELTQLQRQARSRARRRSARSSRVWPSG